MNSKFKVLNLDKLESPSHKDALCHMWLKFRRKRFSNLVNVFFFYFVISPLKKMGVLYLNKLESPLSKNALC